MKEKLYFFATLTVFALYTEDRSMSSYLHSLLHLPANYFLPHSAHNKSPDKKIPCWQTATKNSRFTGHHRYYYDHYFCGGWCAVVCAPFNPGKGRFRSRSGWRQMTRVGFQWGYSGNHHQLTSANVQLETGEKEKEEEEAPAADHSTHPVLNTRQIGFPFS